MNPTEQGALFARVKERWSSWSNRKASGYVNGVVDGLQLSEPESIYVQDFGADAYADGYIYGFIDAFGSDALAVEWYQGLPMNTDPDDYRWWEK